MAERAMVRIDDRTGAIWEFRDGRWQQRGGAGELGGGEAALVGAGRALTQMGRGVANVASYALGEQPGRELRGELARREAEEGALYAPLAEEHPTATFLGELAPEAASGVVPLRLGAQLALGGLMGGARYAEDPLQQLQNAALGAVASGVGYGVGAGVGAGARRLVPMSARVSRAIQSAGRRARGGPDAGAPPPGAARAAPPRGGEVRLEGTLEPADELSQVVAAEQMAAAGREASELATGGRVAGELLQDLTPAKRATFRQGEELGWRFDVGDVNESAARVRASLESHPWTAEIGAARRVHNRDLLLRNLARGLGVPEATDLGPTTLNTAHQRAAQAMRRVEESVQGWNPTELKRVAQEIVDEGRIGVGGRTEATDLAARVVDQIGDQVELDGRKATLWRGEINRAYRNATPLQGPTDPIGAQNLLKLQDAMDQAIQRAAPHQVGLYKRARESWRLLKAVRRGAVLGPGGEVNVRSLANSLNRVYEAEFGRGADGALGAPVRDALRTARVARDFAPTIGDSGTATRLSIPQMVARPWEGGVLSLAGRMAGAVDERLGLGQLTPGTAATTAAASAAPAPPGLMDALTQPTFGSSVGAAVGRALAASEQRRR